LSIYLYPYRPAEPSTPLFNFQKVPLAVESFSERVTILVNLVIMSHGGFKVDDKVDADYFRNGSEWFKGVVTELLGIGRFIVKFDIDEEEMIYAPRDYGKFVKALPIEATAGSSTAQEPRNVRARRAEPAQGAATSPSAQEEVSSRSAPVATPPGAD
jgi:hypothetical protein